ncbi:hypothetical protein [Lewinella sp. IMCC34183]|nr:hypothetical protein [Lewinella sp. IMCC34183]
MLVILPILLIFTLLVIIPVLVSMILFRTLEAKRLAKRVPVRVER